MEKVLSLESEGRINKTYKSFLKNKVSHSDFHWKGNGWPYKEGLALQKEFVNNYNLIPQYIASEHAPVFSVGRSLNTKEKFINQIPIVNVERGGKAMFHGPGQLTIYPIIKISDYFKGPRDYVCFLFKSLKDYFLLEHGVDLVSFDNGLWTIDDNNKPFKKVIFIGLRISKGISYHGFSINYSCDLDNFKLMSPCNISSDLVGNIFKKDYNLKLESEKIVSNLKTKIIKTLDVESYSY